MIGIPFLSWVLSFLSFCCVVCFVYFFSLSLYCVGLSVSFIIFLCSKELKIDLVPHHKLSVYFLIIKNQFFQTWKKVLSLRHLFLMHTKNFFSISAVTLWFKKNLFHCKFILKGTFINQKSRFRLDLLAKKKYLSTKIFFSFHFISWIKKIKLKWRTKRKILNFSKKNRF